MDINKTKVINAEGVRTNAPQPGHVLRTAARLSPRAKGLTVVACAVLLGVPNTVVAATRYVRAGATGAGDGTDWANAYPSLPSVLTRGDVYFVADGDYPSYLFDDPLSATQPITLRKATLADHGTATGWSNAYGDGQARFTAPLKFRTGYYIFDGAIRNETNWFDSTAYGFVVANTTGDFNQTIKVGGLTSNGDYDYGGPAAHFVQFRYTAAVAQVMPVAGVRSYQFDVESGTPTTGFLAHRVLVENGNNSFFLRNTEGATVEYSAVWKAKSSTDNHGEVFNLYYNSDGAVVRFNLIKDNYDPGFSPNTEGYYAGTAVIAIVLSANVQIYGNVFDNNCVTDATVGFNRPTSGYAVPNVRLFNNTSRSRFGPNGFILPAGSTGLAKNNLFLEASPGWENITHDFNGTMGSSLSGEPNGQMNIPTTLFRNYLGRDFRLQGHTSPGEALGSPYATDLLGSPRDPTNWDRGAYQYVAPTQTPAAPTTLTVR